GNSGTTLPKLSKHLPMGRCLGRVVGTKFHCRNSDRFIFGSKYLVGLVMLESNTLVPYSPKLS
ncbi:hypothetical protein, partial [Leptospira weilii]|uniref:hypothetical protein n=1 Tax=Leptospira weilii TaxID=28184 RepID=UPI0009BF60D9